MKKKLVIIAVEQKIAEGYKKDIVSFFEDSISVEAKSLEKHEIIERIDANLIIISTHSIFRLVKQYTPQNCEIIKINRTISKKGYDKVKNLSTGTKALVVNVGPNTSKETLSLLYSICRKDIELFPYYPGIKEYPNSDVAITPGETDLVPAYTKNIIDIGNRVTDVSTILDIIINLNLNKEKYKQKILDYYNTTLPVNNGIKNIVTENYKLENQLDMLFENLNEGIIIYNKNGSIKDISRSACNLVAKNYGEIFGKNIKEILNIKDKEIFSLSTIEKVLEVNQNNIIVTIVPAKKVGLNDGGILILKKFSDIERKINEHRKIVMNKGHKSKYKLNDIIGDSREIKKCKQIAIRMAKSESSVLITGESGTGKELFAHILHNNSKRRYNQFVAVNCSSFPENLLESELFGYEEGAFTGARKGGKQGLFEIAHGGTLFLDEIGEMPLHLQNRLLRVLQEQEVMRIGGDKVMHIDVRIIAATNIELELRIKEGKFRKDLYYRLNVLPLNIPSLKERREDILIIFEHYRKKYNGKFVLSDDVKDFFKKYRWEGNIRELKNYIEYFANLDKLIIEVDDIPKKNMPDLNYSKIEKNYPSEDKYIKILKILYSYYVKKKKIGRKQMSTELEYQNIYLSEQETRDCLKALEYSGYVEITRGRGGTRITNNGIKYLSKR